VAPNWKVLGGLRWDRFEGDYVSPATTAGNGTEAPAAERSRSDSLWSQRLRRALAADRPQLVLLLVRHLVQHFRRALQLRRARRQGAAREKPQPRARRKARPARRPGLDAGIDLSLDQVQRAQPRLADRPADRGLHPFRRAACFRFELDIAGRITSAWEVYASYAWIPSAKIDKAAPNGTLTGEQVGDRPSLTPRHSGTIFTTYQLTPAIRLGGRPECTQLADAEPQSTRQVVAPSFVTGDLLAEYTVSQQVAFKLNVLNVTDKLYADSLYKPGTTSRGSRARLYASMT
jgi:catecholate siderophore receptor